MHLIHLDTLAKKFPDGTEALRGISFSIEKGSFVAIMGPSGSGKSTLLNILGFLDRQSNGVYMFEDKNAFDYSEDELAHIRNAKMGFIFQSFNLLPKLSVLDNILLPLSYSDTPKSEWKKRAEDAVESVGLEHRSEHDVTKISGGEKQRVAIARALVNNPEVIFADEPTGNLDSKSGQVIMETIERLHQREGRTIILITHESYAAGYAERIITLKDGEVVEDNNLRERHTVGGIYKK